MSYTARPLNKLKGKKEWSWTEEHHRVFKELKDKIISQLVLSLLKREDKFRVKMDALGYTIEGLLSQEQEGKWRPIAFYPEQCNQQKGIMRFITRNY